MEKTRRKRINNSLDQLRTLLPYSANMKKDMASLLEQTVEYVNIIHTILNNDKPDCLGKVYQAYRQKTEEIERFRKNLKKLKKQKLEAGTTPSPNQLDFPSFNGGNSSFGRAPAIESAGTKQFYPSVPHPNPSLSNNFWPQQNTFDSFARNYQNFNSIPCAPVTFFHQPPALSYFKQPSSSTQRNFPASFNSGFAEDVRILNQENHEKVDLNMETCENNIVDRENHENIHNLVQEEHGEIHNLNQENPEDNHNLRQDNQADASNINQEIRNHDEELQENDDHNSTASSTTSLQASSDDVTTEGQSQNSDIATAAIATGILSHDQSEDCKSVADFNDAIKEELGFEPNDSWLLPGSLPPLSLGQSNFVTCDDGAPSLYSHGKFCFPPFIPQ